MLGLLCFTKQWTSLSPSLPPSTHFGSDLEWECDRLLLKGVDLDIESLGVHENLDEGEANL
jgi:hypothetical protein